MTEPAVVESVHLGFFAGDKIDKSSSAGTCGSTHRSPSAFEAGTSQQEGGLRATHRSSTSLEQVSETLDRKATVRLAAMHSSRDVKATADLALRERVHILREVVQERGRLSVRIREPRA